MKIRKMIEVERIVVDKFIESFKEIYLEMGLEEKGFEKYCKKNIFNHLWGNEDYRAIRNEKGEIIEVNCSPRIVRCLLRNEMKNKKVEYIATLKKFKNVTKEFLKGSEATYKVYKEFVDEIGASEFLSVTEALYGLCRPNTGNRILVDQGVLLKTKKGKFYDEEGYFLNEELEDKKYGELMKYHGYGENTSVFKWTTKGAEYIRDIVSKNLEPELKEKYIIGLLKKEEEERKKAI